MITDAGEPEAEPNVPDRVVLSATLGEPLVKVVAFGHGLRRALSPSRATGSGSRCGARYAAPASSAAAR